MKFRSFHRNRHLRRTLAFSANKYSQQLVSNSPQCFRHIQASIITLTQEKIAVKKNIIGDRCCLKMQAHLVSGHAALHASQIPKLELRENTEAVFSVVYDVPGLHSTWLEYRTLHLFALPSSLDLEFSSEMSRVQGQFYPVRTYLPKFARNREVFVLQNVVLWNAREEI